MPVPKFHEIMIPLLSKYTDNLPHKTSEFYDFIIDYFKLTQSDVDEKTNDGTSRLFGRINWAKTFLSKSDFLEKVERGSFKITKKGVDFLNLKWKKINFKEIVRIYPDLMETEFWNSKLRTGKNDKKNENSTPQEIKSYQSENENINFESPEDILDRIISEKKDQVCQEILEEVKKIHPRLFENLVVKLLVAMGYGTQEHSFVTNYSNDKGIDGVIQADDLGFEIIQVQAKKYEGNIGAPSVREFVGSIKGGGKGVFVTTSDFTKDALECIKGRNEKVVLIDGKRLSQLMFKYNQGVSISQTIQLKAIDIDYFQALE